jgi:hypothetical protein
MMWGRLLYDPTTPDEVFAAEFDRRYGPGTGESLVKAHRLAGRMPLRLASFHAATWDYTLYSEGFLAPVASRGLSDSISPFISILEFIDHETLDPTFLSIPDYVDQVVDGDTMPKKKVTPIELADASERDANEAIEVLTSVRSRISPFSGALECEVLDLEAWSYLGLYLAEKLRAGVALETYRRTGVVESKDRAIEHLQNALHHWDRVVEATEEHYRPTPHVFTQMYEWAKRHEHDLRDQFSWARLRDEVVRDIELARDVEPAAK